MALTDAGPPTRSVATLQSHTSDLAGRAAELTLKGSLLESPHGMARPLGTWSALVPIQRGQAQAKHHVVRGPLHYYGQPQAEKASRNQKRDHVRKSTFVLLHAQWHVHCKRGAPAQAEELLQAR